MFQTRQRGIKRKHQAATHAVSGFPGVGSEGLESSTQTRSVPSAFMNFSLSSFAAAFTKKAKLWPYHGEVSILAISAGFPYFFYAR